jgi:hypothetical protein
VSILTTDIGFTKFTATEFTPPINKLSMNPSRRYMQYGWSV